MHSSLVSQVADGFGTIPSGNFLKILTPAGKVGRGKSEASAMARKIPEYCDFDCPHADFPPADTSGLCRTMAAVWCKKLKELVNKHTPCQWKKRIYPFENKRLDGIYPVRNRRNNVTLCFIFYTKPINSLIANNYVSNRWLHNFGSS